MKCWCGLPLSAPTVNFLLITAAVAALFIIFSLFTRPR